MNYLEEHWTEYSFPADRNGNAERQFEAAVQRFLHGEEFAVLRASVVSMIGSALKIRLHRHASQL